MEAINPLINPRALTKQALAEIYEQHSPGVFRYAYRLLGDQETAEDCVSDTFSRFLRAIRHMETPIDNIQAYLYRMAHNWVMDHFRKQPLPPLSLDDDLHPNQKDNPSSQVAKKMIQERVRAALLRLPAEQQQVIQLRFLEDWSHDEVAAALGKSPEATRALQHRAMESLRRLLIEKGNDK